MVSDSCFDAHCSFISKPSASSGGGWDTRPIDWSTISQLGKKIKRESLKFTLMFENHVRKKNHSSIWTYFKVILHCKYFLCIIYSTLDVLNLRFKTLFSSSVLPQEKGDFKNVSHSLLLEAYGAAVLKTLKWKWLVQGERSFCSFWQNYVYSSQVHWSLE